ncbi:hypothetical protein Tco_0109101 [Tanacetum coccineum]
MSFETKLPKDEDGKSVDNTKYRSMTGSLLYFMASRSGIMFSVCLCARFQEDHKSSHHKDIKRIFRYIKGTTHLGLWDPIGTGVETIKQTVLAISTTESEYVIAGKACQQALWMKQALVDYDIKLTDILVLCENKGAIDLRKISREKVSSEDNIADILTKPLKREPVNLLKLGLGLMKPNA